MDKLTENIKENNEDIYEKDEFDDFETENEIPQCTKIQNHEEKLIIFEKEKAPFKGQADFNRLSYSSSTSSYSLGSPLSSVASL